MNLAEIVAFARTHWGGLIVAAIVGAVAMNLLVETTRWWLGKGFFQ